MPTSFFKVKNFSGCRKARWCWYNLERGFVSQAAQWRGMMALQNKRYAVFFAFPFDPATYQMYKGIISSLQRKKQFAGSFDFRYGFDQVISPTPHKYEREAFKTQNTDLITQFRSIILASDIVIADMTNDNPNVH